MQIGATYKDSCMDNNQSFRTLVCAVEVEKAGETVSVLADCADKVS